MVIKGSDEREIVSQKSQCLKSRFDPRLSRLLTLDFFIFMKMSAARILICLTLPKKFRILRDSNTLGYLLKLYKVDNSAWRQ